MSTSSGFSVTENDVFRQKNFPGLISDINNISRQIAHLSSVYKAEIIISYIRNHSLENEWIMANPELARLVTAEKLSVNNIKGLFDASLHNPLFQLQLEAFLKYKLEA